MNRFRATLALVAVAAMLVLSVGTAAAQDPTAVVDPSDDLSDGDTVTVTVSGFPASSEAFVSGQCVTPIEDLLQQCNVGNVVPVPLDANGEGTFEITVNTGVIGSGNCGFDADDCVIVVGSLTESEIAVVPITFAEEELALTGPTHLTTFFTVGLLALAAGLFMMMTNRRRSGSHIL